MVKIEVPVELTREPTEDEATEKSGNWAGGKYRDPVFKST